MGVAGLIFEPRPPNFENHYNFWRCLNGIKTIFWYLFWFQIFRKSGWVSSPFLKLVLGLGQKEITQYSARIEQTANSNLGAFLTPEYANTSQVLFTVKFRSNSRTVHEEMRLYDEIWLVGSVGGSLGLFVGFSLFDSVAVLFDKFLDLLSKT